MTRRLILGSVLVLLAGDVVSSQNPQPNKRCDVTVTAGAVHGGPTTFTCNSGGTVQCNDWQTFNYTYGNLGCFIEPERVCTAGSTLAYTSVEYKIVANLVSCQCEVDTSVTRNPVYESQPKCLDTF